MSSLRSMNAGTGYLAELVEDTALLLATAEQLAKSMNGRSSRSIGNRQ